MEAPQAIAIRNKIIGILVKRARLQSGKSQRECGELLGCSASTFSQYEQGRRGLSLPQLEALAYLLDVPAVSLWDDDYSPPEKPEAEPIPLAQMIQLRRKILAVKFRQCRHAAGLTQQEMGELLRCSAYMVGQYERGNREIPLADLEIVAEKCEQPMADFMDEETIPLGEAEQARQTLARLDELPPDVKSFVLNPTNSLYLRIALLLSTMKADSLRQIAETLLDITY